MISNLNFAEYDSSLARITLQLRIKKASNHQNHMLKRKNFNVSC